MRQLTRAFLLIAALGLFATACSHRVELFCDEDTPCTDPERPFCDLLGEHAASEGIRNTCIPDPNAGMADASVPDAPEAADAGVDAEPSADGAPNADACVPQTCGSLNCGQISDGCGNMIGCGTCTPPETCAGAGTDNMCGCTPTTCAAQGAECGSMSDGCGATLDCADTCTGEEVCGANSMPNKCGIGPCVPKTCIGEGKDCGPLSDGCAMTLQCGDCTLPESCGGANEPNVCGCTPTNCLAEAAECGSISNKCGGNLTCPDTCTGTDTCAGGGDANKCGCTPTTSCAAQGRNCGTVDTGCGIENCGNCTDPETCAGGGAAGVCGCTDATACDGLNCGTVTDACGVTQTCGGSCTGTDTCGGGGMTNVCGCTPTTSCAAQGKDCDSVDTGCGIENCGTCGGFDTCAGGGMAGVCGCTPTTCVAEGKDCGTIDDECGGTTPSCGSCTSPESCGTNEANVCGCTPNTSTCTGDQLVVCDGGGQAGAPSTCALGCHASGTHCNDLDPTNGLAGDLDLAAGQPMLVLPDGSTINTDTGAVSDGTSSVTVSQRTEDSPPSGGVAFLVLRVGGLNAGNVVVTGTRGLAIVSDGDIVITGDLRLGDPALPATAAPGAWGGCSTDNNVTDPNLPGAGGGSFGSRGGRGGSGTGSGTSTGTLAPPTVLVSPLVPLRGGCNGGNVPTSSGPWRITGGLGGGALQMSSRTEIRVGDGGSTGSVRADGRATTHVLFNPSNDAEGGGAGGGSGGGILLEAPVVTITSGSGFSANGGAGSCGIVAGPAGSYGTVAAAGATCASAGDGGDGATIAVVAKNGANGAAANGGGGGGGGGAGHIWVVTLNDAGYSAAPGSIESGVVTTKAMVIR